MLIALEVLSLFFVAVTMALSLAHALELPGKRRLDEDHYRAVQTIYYPGFTVGRIAEPLAIATTLLLLMFTPVGTWQFALRLAACAALVGVQLIYWLWTHPVNRAWTKGVELGKAGARFFEAKPTGPSISEQDWRRLRDRWEWSHVARTAAAVSAFLLLATANAL